VGSQHFKKAKYVNIGDYANFSTVRGDQYIHVHQRVEEKRAKLAINGDEDEEAEYGQVSSHLLLARM